MSTPAIIALASVGLLLLTTLVAFGVGHRRWSWVSVAASFLVVFALGGYLYLAARLLQFEWRWVQAVRATRQKLDEVRDAKRPSAETGRLQPIPDLPSLVDLRTERERWQRTFERVDNWRGRHWQKASFRPPTGAAPGAIQLPPSAIDRDAEEPDDEAVEPARRPQGQPVDPGVTVYVFDETPAAEGGRYLGEFLVQAVDSDPATGGLTLAVAETAPPDDYDRAAWSRAYDAVTVYATLPVDRWLAFSRIPKAARSDGSLDDAIAPQPAKRPEEELAELVPEPFLAAVERHALSARDAGEAETIPEADWPALREEVAAGETLPGELWAEVVFQDQVDLDAFLGLERDGLVAADDGLAIEAELGRAFDLQSEGKAAIRKVFRRRRLIDAATLVHGSLVPGGEAAGGDVMTDGLAALMQLLQRDIAALDTANAKLAQSQEHLAAEQRIVAGQAAELAADLTTWERDLAAATKLADAFEVEATRAAARLAATEGEVVRLGRELNDAVEEAVREIDRIAPPADRGAAAPATTF